MLNSCSQEKKKVGHYMCCADEHFHSVIVKSRRLWKQMTTITPLQKMIAPKVYGQGAGVALDLKSAQL